MGRSTKLLAVAALSFAALSLSALILVAGAGAERHNPFRRQIGSYLGGENTGVCPVVPPARKRICTVSEAEAHSEITFGHGRYPRIPGHIVGFRLHPGLATADTRSIRVRFRVLRGLLGAGGPASSWFELPLHARGSARLQEFPANVPFVPGDRIGLDVEVRGDGHGEAAAPLAGTTEQPFGIAEWSPPLGSAKRRARIRSNASLSLSAVFERDDRYPPVLQSRFAHHQDFLRTGRVYMQVRSNERALLNPEAGLQVPGETWGIVHNQPHLRPHRWAWFVCELEPSALHAARTAVRRGGKTYVSIRLVAFDRAGNVARPPQLNVLP